jgi:hypothetical protein
VKREQQANLDFEDCCFGNMKIFEQNGFAKVSFQMFFRPLGSKIYCAPFYTHFFHLSLVRRKMKKVQCDASNEQNPCAHFGVAKLKMLDYVDAIL